MIICSYPRLTIANKIRRGFWNLVQNVLLRPSPRIAHGWRRFWLRRFGARIAANCLVYPTVRIWAPWNLKMGPAAVLGDGVDCYNVAPVHLGPGAIVSQRAFLCTASHDHRREDFALIAGKIEVLEGGWVSAEAFIGPGVVIGDFSIVAARAVVVRDVEAYSIVGGNPANFIGDRTKVKTLPGESISRKKIKYFSKFL